MDARCTVQTDDVPFEPKAGHAVKVIRNHRHLPLSNMKGVGSIPPPFNGALHQGSTRKLLQEKTNYMLKAYFPNIAPGFIDKKILPLHHFISDSLASIRG